MREGLKIRQRQARGAGEGRAVQISLGMNYGHGTPAATHVMTSRLDPGTRINRRIMFLINMGRTGEG